MAGQTGNRTLITFSTNNFTASYRQIGGLREYHAILDETDLTDSYEQSFAAALRRSDPIEIELYWQTDWSLIPNSTTPAGANNYVYDAADGPPLGANNQTVIITYPPNGAQINGAKRTFKAVITEVTSPVLANETELTGSFMLKIQERGTYTVAS